MAIHFKMKLKQKSMAIALCLHDWIVCESSYCLYLCFYTYIHIFILFTYVKSMKMYVHFTVSLLLGMGLYFSFIVHCFWLLSLEFNRFLILKSFIFWKTHNLHRLLVKNFFLGCHYSGRKHRNAFVYTKRLLHILFVIMFLL